MQSTIHLIFLSSGLRLYRYGANDWGRYPAPMQRRAKALNRHTVQKMAAITTHAVTPSTIL